MNAWGNLLDRAGRHRVAAVLVALILALHFLTPELQPNEAGKLVYSRQLLDSSFLNRDWIQARGTGDSIFDTPFALVMAPLWLVFKNATMVALAGRLMVWVGLLFALVRLARALGIGWLALAAGLIA